MSSDDAERAAIDQALEDAVQRGWMEHAGRDDEGNQLYRLKVTGNEALQAGIEAARIITDADGVDTLARRRPRSTPVADTLDRRRDRDLTPVAEEGTVIIHRDGRAGVVARRKEDGTGWWLVGGAGLDYDLLAGDDWKVLDRDTVLRLWEPRIDVAELTEIPPGADVPDGP